MFNPSTARPETRHPARSRCFGGAAQILNSVVDKWADDASVRPKHERFLSVSHTPTWAARTVLVK